MCSVLYRILQTTGWRVSALIDIRSWKTGEQGIDSIFFIEEFFTGIMMNESGLYTIKDLLFDRNQDPNQNAIECPGMLPMTYHELRMQVLSVVKTLNTRGFHRNDRIAVIMPAGPETAVTIISVMAGFTCIALNPQETKQEYQRYFTQLKIKAIIVQTSHETAATMAATSRDIPVIELIPVCGRAGKFEMEPPFVQDAKEAEFASPTDISHIFLTSGTTSRSKIVPVSQKQSFFSRQIQIKPFKITNTDRCLHIVPYYHGLGIGLPLLGILLAGGTVICTKDFIPSDFYSLLKKFRPTYYIAVPALHQGILRELNKFAPDELEDSSLRLILSSSASMPDRVRHGLEKLLHVPVIEILASSESGTISINFPPKHGSVGIPVIEHLTIRSETNKILRPYEEGEIVVKGEAVFSGYEDAPDENDAAFIDGWFRTGDMGYLDDEGYLFLTGRKKEIINKGGRKIAPEEIDTVLREHPQVKDAMTFGIADPVLGEDVAAIVVPADETITEADLRMYLLDRLIQFKVPRKIWFVDRIPRTPTGKPQRQEGTRRFSPGL